MAQVLKAHSSLSLEMRDALKLLVGQEGYRSWAGSFINGTPVRTPTIRALIRRELVEEWRAPSGTWRFSLTKLGRDVVEG